MKRCLLVLLSILLFSAVRAQDFCGLRNTSYRAGEAITLKVYYNLGKIYVGAGEATLVVASEKLDGRDVYHITAFGKTYRSYDWIFKVRDTYESFIDTATLQPYKFLRNVNEGGYKINHDVSFDHEANTATSTKKKITTPHCVQDVISAVYYARNIDFNKYKVNDKITFNMYLDDQVYEIYIRYLGKEEVDTRFGKFRAIKFKPLLLKGTAFTGGEQMTVWVSDDANKVPLRIDSPISVGSIKVDMIEYKNLRYAFTSLIDKR
ncbi:Protein of unknown function [Chitinophaga costaii]|uniref:DUF3108 domain-containing protein n=1 Tax=Chitinophaga costaii TaxID=1335309 RepID=A0A1C4F3F9_9BACT|nr:DUF3108 domain-containing protein [Chitinophaga costaii]PUZ22090.1 DUF3108 domain-containing protein [Chitinophaga costaii]SCC50507.1 Protein of unknown function [Chitinophaga costaii]